MNTPRRYPSWLAPVAGWTGLLIVAVGLGLLARSPFHAQEAAMGRMAPRIPAPATDFRTLLFMLGIGSPVWYAAALVSPFLAFGARRLEPDRIGWPRTIGIAALVLVAIATVTCLIQYGVDYGGLSNRPKFLNYLAVIGPPQLLPWAALGGLIAVAEGRRRTVRSSIERERLRAQLAEQTLITLTAQLQPHFLFNTLQGISTLIHRDPDAADELLAKLADLLREILRHRDQVMVSLAEEVRFARIYLEIMQLRFGDRLTFALEVPNEILPATVPLFILQPLIENAASHGIGASLEGGRIVVRGSTTGSRLRLEVIDDGAGVPAEPARGEGLGLANTRARLAASYGDDYRFDLAPGPAGGMVATIDIPRR